MIDVLPAHIRNMMEKRLSICNACPKYDVKVARCMVCGCYMKVKTLLPNVKCPENKW